MKSRRKRNGTREWRRCITIIIGSRILKGKNQMADHDRIMLELLVIYVQKLLILEVEQGVDI